MALLNSQLVHFFYSNLTSTIRGGYLRFIRQYLAQIPVIEPDKEVREKIENIAKQIMDIKSNDSKIDTRSLENQIDQFVYEMYGLSEEEIGIVEGQKRP